MLGGAFLAFRIQILTRNIGWDRRKLQPVSDVIDDCATAESNCETLQGKIDSKLMIRLFSAPAAQTGCYARPGEKGVMCRFRRCF
jgi:hypothetical protein